MSRFVESNGIQLHLLDRAGGAPPLLLLPGLTANAHSFDGLVAADLSPRFRTVAVDFRGRGLSDKPARGYSMEAYTADVIGVLDALEIPRAVLVGHSFGGLIAMIAAARHPQRVAQLVLIDASHLLITAETVALIKASLDRLGRRVASLDAYLQTMRRAPFLHGYWDAHVASYFRADVAEFEDGTVQPHTPPQAIAETIEHEYAEPWAEDVAAVTQPVLLLNATEPYGPPGAPPILPAAMAQETAALFADCTYRHVPGNHVTLLFGANARAVAAAITDFVERND